MGDPCRMCGPFTQRRSCRPAGARAPCYTIARFLLTYKAELGRFMARSASDIAWWAWHSSVNVAWRSAPLHLQAPILHNDTKQRASWYRRAGCVYRHTTGYQNARGAKRRMVAITKEQHSKSGNHPGRSNQSPVHSDAAWASGVGKAWRHYRGKS